MQKAGKEFTTQQKQAFAFNDKRKDQLFDALFKLFDETDKSLCLSPTSPTLHYEKIFEGRLTPTLVSAQHMVLKPEKGKCLKPVVINTEVAKHLQAHKDILHMKLVYLSGKWWIWDVFSITTLMPPEGIHFTLNPYLSGKYQNKPNENNNLN